MTEQAGVIETARALAARAASPRGQRAIGRWTTSAQLEAADGVTADGDRVCHLLIGSDGVTVEAGAHIHPGVVLRGEARAIARGLTGEIDFTHLIAAGDLSVTGNYYDMINLGRLAAAVRGRPAVTA